MDISPATLEDCRAIAEVHVLSWQHAYRDLLPADYLASLAVDRREAIWRGAIASGTPRLLVARAAGGRPGSGSFAVSGFVAFGRSRDADAPALTAEIWAIYVAPSFWAQGQGRALWLAAQQEIRRAGFAAVTLWVIARNTQARRFYAAAGFAPETDSTKSFTLGGTQLEEVRYVREIESAGDGSLAGS
jgi:ribosomal protein S18 acetylase RimI-like enzyme